MLIDVLTQTKTADMGIGLAEIPCIGINRLLAVDGEFISEEGAGQLLEVVEVLIFEEQRTACVIKISAKM